MSDLLMTYAGLLRAGAAEVRDYGATPGAAAFDRQWLLSLARDMEAAAGLRDVSDMESAIDAFAYAIVDRGPLTADFAPSFHRASDALQRRRKRSSNTS